MARLSLVDRLKKEGQKTKDELDKSENLLKKISAQKANVEPKLIEREQKTVAEADRQTDKQTDRQISRQISRPLDRQISRQISRPQNGQIAGQIDEQIENNPFYWMTEKQISVFSFLVSKKQHITRLNDIERGTNVPYGTVRGAIKKLVSEGCISEPRRYRRGRFHGISYVVDEALEKTFKDWIQERQIGAHIERQIHKQTDMQTDMQTGPYIEEEENIYLLLKPDRIQHIYPSLHNIGFEQKHLKEIIEAWRLQKFNLDELPESLERASSAIEGNKDKIKDPLNYIYASLMKGSFAKPAGFLTRAEKEARDRIEEAKRIKTLNEEAETLEFKNWWNGLDQQQQDDIDNKSKMKFEKNGLAMWAHRKNQFHKQS